MLNWVAVAGRSHTHIVRVVFGLLRPLRVWLLLLLLTPQLSGCVSPVYGMAARSESASPTPAPTSSQGRAEQEEETRAATPEPNAGALSLDSVRSLLSHEDDSRGSAHPLPKVLYRSPLHSPLVAPIVEPAAPEAAGAAVILLPTPTPTRVLATTVSLDKTALPTPTAAITDMLALALPVPEEPAPAPPAIALPTPTPQMLAAAPDVEPTPDDTTRTVRVPILMYHYLSVPPPDANIYRQDLSVSPDLFAAHLDAIQGAGYSTITLYDLVARLTQGTSLPEKPVILTFDDGYRDVYENAFPLLREHGMLATFFVVTDFIDEQRPEYLSWDMAREMLAAGMSIESHGRNHVSLAGKDKDYLVWQALGSLETIEHELGTRPRFVSYPAGEYDRNVAELFASAGYWAGATTAQGATHSSDALFDLKRVRVRGTTSPEELLRLLTLEW